MVITNGSKHPNEKQGNDNEDFFEMAKKLNLIATLKELVESEEFIKSIIAYNGDRHFFYVFICLINEALNDKSLKGDSLKWFRNGMVAQWIINIDKTVSEYGNRASYPAEILDKLNYLASLNDAKSFVSCFFHHDIIEVLDSDSKNIELTYWTRNLDIPLKGRVNLAYKCIDDGKIEAGKKILLPATDELAYC